MPFPILRSRALRAFGAATSLFSLTAPAGAFTPSDLPQPNTARQPTVALYRQSVDQPKLEQVWCRWGCGGWRGGGWGWRGGAFVGGLAAGALIGGALAAPYYGGPYGYYGAGPYYPDCWRSVWTYYGWRRVWVC
jgi:hypothetical protein